MGGDVTGISTMVSGYLQSDATQNAADTQAQAATDANQLQYKIFQEQQALMQPWIKSGQGNLERLNYALYGQAPGASQMQLDPKSQEYKNWIAANPQQPTFSAAPKPVFAGYNDDSGNPVMLSSPSPLPGSPVNATAPTLYRNPLTGETTTTAPDLSGQMGVKAGGLSPDWRFSTQDWKDSPEYAVYSGARDAAVKRAQEALMAQGAASGMYGSGTMANALSQNMGELYAQYDPASLAAARQAAEAARTQEYNMLAGLSSPSGAQQVAQYAGQYGQQAGQNMINAGNAQAAGQMGVGNIWANNIQAMQANANSTGGQVMNALGRYYGQQQFQQPYQQPYQGAYQQPYQQPQYQQYDPGYNNFGPADGGFYAV